MKKLNEELSRLGERLTQLIKTNINNIHKDEIAEVCDKIRKVRKRIEDERKYEKDNIN
jgi:hypothetical protein